MKWHLLQVSFQLKGLNAQEVGNRIWALPSLLLAVVQPRFTPIFVNEWLCQERNSANVLSLRSWQMLEVKHDESWFSCQEETDGNAVKLSHLSLRLRSSVLVGQAWGAST